MKRWFRRLIMTSVMSLICSSLTPFAPVAFAQQSERPDGGVVAAGAGDDGVLEVGVEYVNWYPGSGDLYGTDDDALSLYNELGNGGWTKRYAYGNSSAWEEDWKASWYGGTEYNYVDQVDLAYFSGHGGPSYDYGWGRYLWGPVFGDGGNLHDDSYLVPSDGYRAYGDGDVEWIAFSACQTLNDQSYPYWASTFYGSHLLMGFRTNMLDVNQGYWFGRYIRYGYTLPQAWHIATDITHPYGYQTRILANEYCHFSDRYYTTCGDSYDWDYWEWTRTSDTLVAASASGVDGVDHIAEVSELPVLDVIAPLSTEDSVGNLGESFGMAADTPASLDAASDLYRAISDTLDLTVDKQGVFYFVDMSNLFTVTENIVLGASPLVTADEAHQIAESYLITRNLKPDDAAFKGVSANTMKSLSISEPVTSTVQLNAGISAASADLVTTVLDEQILNYEVVYQRNIQVTKTDGTTATVAVDGPGSQLKVYVNADGTVTGVMGGWRAVQASGVKSASAHADDITAAQVETLYEALGDVVSIVPSTFNADTWKVNASSVTYYEPQLGIQASGYRPAYALDVTQSNSKNGSAIDIRVHVPGNAKDIAPLARIDQPTSDGIVTLGTSDTLTFTAADASQTLAASGLDASLDFSLGQGPYTYTWSSAHDNKVLGTGRNLTLQGSQMAATVDAEHLELPVLTLVLKVTDANGKSSEATKSLHIPGVTTGISAFLPLVTR